MKSLNYILLTVLILILSWMGYILFDIYSEGNSLIGNIVPIISSFICFIIIVLIFLILSDIRKINATSLLLGSISLLFVLIMFISPPFVLSLWHYATSIFVLFLSHGLYLLTGAGESGTIHKITLALATLFLVTILLLKIHLSIVHLIATVLCLAVTLTSLLSISIKRNK